MPSLISTYANHCGVKIPQEPVLPYTKYFVVPEKYISVQTGSGQKSKNYDHFNIVFQYLSKILSKYGIEVVQVGSPEDYLINGAKDYRGKTDFYQSTYIVKNAKLHVGNDSVFQHVAGVFNVPFVVPFGPTLSKVCASHYSHPDSIIIESHRNGNRATHSAQESPKTINLIKPEEIINSILKILKIEEHVSLETQFIGSEFYDSELHILPNFLPAKSFYPEQELIVRMDLAHNEAVLWEILKNRKCHIVCSNPFDVKILEECRENILGIEYKPWQAVDPQIQFVSALGKFRNSINTWLQGKDLDKLKLALFEYAVVTQKKNVENFSIKGKYFKTGKIFFSEGREYLSKWHIENGLYQPAGCNSGPIPPVIEQSFLNGKEFYFIYNQ